MQSVGILGSWRALDRPGLFRQPTERRQADFAENLCVGFGGSIERLPHTDEFALEQPVGEGFRVGRPAPAEFQVQLRGPIRNSRDLAVGIVNGLEGGLQPIDQVIDEDQGRPRSPHAG